MSNSSGSHAHQNGTDYARSAHDLYVTPPEAVERLLRDRPILIEVKTWDASAGLGHIVKTINDAGGHCTGTDLHDHPYQKVAPVITGVDALSLLDPFASVAVINPPYNAAHDHIDHLRRIGCTVYALVRLNFIAAKRHAELMKHCSHVLILGRVKILPPDAVDKGMSPTIDFCWLRVTPSLQPLKEVKRI